MIEELRNKIDKLSGSEAKSLLLNTAVWLQTILESNNSQEQKDEELKALYEKVANYSQIKNDIQRKRNYHTIHIVCGESPAGSLMVGLEHGHRVIGFPDFFAVGPVRELHMEEGLQNRYAWLKDHINIPMDFIEKEYEIRFRNTLEQLREIPENVPIVLWTAENASEQVGIRFFLHFLQEKTNEVFLINTSLAFQELYNTKEVQYFVHTGEVHPEKLRTIYEQKRNSPMTDEEKNQLQKEWAELSETKEVLRVLKKDAIQSVPENYYDHHLVTTAQKLHAKRGKEDFIKSARIIGEVYGELAGNVDDSFLEYRLRCLIYDGVFEIRGIPKGMRYYSVRLR
ncbi:DUF1835 domain-containing protein [Bacillus fonticola]|uniref:DUF1835 domain-containing protein n=1 Tax=Bacillus fonticola TaxID=2728853 RepID=UPI001D133414|nr:DUF1835 domain-containing protein [Bacillus fonticola]